MNNNCCVSETFIIGASASGCTANHNIINSCDFDTSIKLDENINIDSPLLPENDNLIDIGSPFKRFREINVVSGSSTIWTSVEISTPSLDLGLDSKNESRILTANNSLFQYDNLNGGGY